MSSSLPDLRGHITALVSGTIPLDRFLDWYFANWNTIEFEGSDEDVELLILVAGLLVEYSGDSIDAAEVVEALGADPPVEKELAAHRSAVA